MSVGDDGGLTLLVERDISEGHADVVLDMS